MPIPPERPNVTPNQAQQHDLAEGPATRMVAEARIDPGTMVLEVGPGLGALTAALLSGGAQVVAIERDPARIAHLRNRFARQLSDHQLTLLSGDALKLHPTMAAPWRVLANPPFNLTAPLVRRWLLATQPAPVAIDLVLQRETAHKLTGGDGGHTRSSIIARLCGTPHVTRHLPRDVVTPPSRVDLAVWSHRRDPAAIDAKALALVDRLLDIAFAGPHTMQNALRGVATGIQIRRQANEHGWHPQDHPRTLTPQAWASLAQLLAFNQPRSAKGPRRR
jgi:16S rRNA A1518/A1519 N6-dimethyltransferase RsmA/KsgA/DIM1 with predicted DNA glycosylase/AP lyase activity